MLLKKRATLNILCSIERVGERTVSICAILETYYFRAGRTSLGLGLGLEFPSLHIVQSSRIDQQIWSQIIIVCPLVGHSSLRIDGTQWTCVYTVGVVMSVFFVVFVAYHSIQRSLLWSDTVQPCFFQGSYPWTVCSWSFPFPLLVVYSMIASAKVRPGSYSVALFQTFLLLD